MIINGFGFSGYRSVGDEIVKVAPLKKINLIIGQNNSGKSNIITFLKNHYSSLADSIKNRASTAYSSFSDTDKHISNEAINTRVAFCLDTNSKDYDNYVNSKIRKKLNCKGLIDKLLKSPFFKDDSGLVWFIYESYQPNGKYNLSVNFSEINPLLDANEWKLLWQRLTNHSGGGRIDTDWIPQTIQVLAFIPNNIPSIEFIPAIRKIGKSDTKPEDFSGFGIIERLAILQNPPLAEQHLRKKFDDINIFVRTVLENESATLDIPHDKSMILVHMDRKTLPLSSLGTGTHEVIILAAAATVLEDSVLCVEEPELHLHPLLQKKLIRYLSEATTNQYLFTTHSAHLLDTEGAEVFHVRYVNDQTVVSAICSTKEKSNICHNLGYRASDILQSNCIIWVEGPSDRIYIKHWLGSIDDSLIEGVHYSIMFYGGRLFSHLTADDLDDENDRVNDFISVRKLNRNTTIVFDSDKSGPKVRLNKTKKRLKEEFNKGPGFAWVTKGREIENYIDPDVIESCVKAIHPSADKIIQKSIWSNTLNYKKKGVREKFTSSKVKVANNYVENYNADFGILDLKSRIKQLREFIYESNGLTI